MSDQRPSPIVGELLVNVAIIVGGFATLGMLFWGTGVLLENDPAPEPKPPVALGEWGSPITVTGGARAALCADMAPFSVEVGIADGQDAGYVYLDGREEKLHAGDSLSLHDDCEIRLERTGRDQTPKALPFAIFSVRTAAR